MACPEKGKSVIFVRDVTPFNYSAKWGPNPPPARPQPWVGPGASPSAGRLDSGGSGRRGQAAAAAGPRPTCRVDRSLVLEERDSYGRMVACLPRGHWGKADKRHLALGWRWDGRPLAVVCASGNSCARFHWESQLLMRCVSFQAKPL